MPLCEARVIILLSGVDALPLVLVHGHDIVRAEVERPDHVERDLAVKTKTLEADRRDLVAVLVEGTNLYSTLGLRGGRERRARLTDWAVEVVIL